MERVMGDWDETAEARRTRRLESFEAQQRLEHFANPEDFFDEIHPDDAHHDLQMSLYRGLARSTGWA